MLQSSRVIMFHHFPSNYILFTAQAETFQKAEQPLLRRSGASGYPRFFILGSAAGAGGSKSLPLKTCVGAALVQTQPSSYFFFVLEFELGRNKTVSLEFGHG